MLLIESGVHLITCILHIWQNPWEEYFSLRILNPCGIKEHLALVQLVYFMLPCIYQ